MENAEEVLQILERFTRLKQKEIPKELDEYLQYVAKSGDPVFNWSDLKYLFREKLQNVIKNFYEATTRGGDADIPQYPNVDPFNYENMKSALLERLELFNAAPFTIQRLCELLIDPRKQYSRIDKFMRALEKNILVVSTIDPGRRPAESENGDSLDSAVNGDISLDVNVDIDMENENIFNVETPNGNGSNGAVSAGENNSNEVQAEKGNGTRAADDDGSCPNPKKAKLDVNVDEIEEQLEKKTQVDEECVNAAEQLKESAKQLENKEAIETAAAAFIEKDAAQETLLVDKIDDKIDEKESEELTVVAKKSDENIVVAIESESLPKAEAVVENGKQQSTKDKEPEDIAENAEKQQSAEKIDEELAEKEIATKKPAAENVVVEKQEDVKEKIVEVVADVPIHSATAAVADEVDKKQTAAGEKETEKMPLLCDEQQMDEIKTEQPKAEDVDDTVVDAATEVSTTIAELAEPAVVEATVAANAAILDEAQEKTSDELFDEVEKNLESMLDGGDESNESAATEAAEANEVSDNVKTLTTAETAKSEEQPPPAEPAEAAAKDPVVEITAGTDEKTDATETDVTVKEQTVPAADEIHTTVTAVAETAAALITDEKTDVKTANSIEQQPEQQNAAVEAKPVTAEKTAKDADVSTDIAETVEKPATLQAIDADVPAVNITEATSEELPTGDTTTITPQLPNLALNDQPMEDMPIEEPTASIANAVDEVVMAEEAVSSIEMATDAMETAASKDEPAGMEVDDTSQEAMDQ